MDTKNNMDNMKTYHVSRKNIVREVLAAAIFLLVDIFVLLPLSFEVLSLIWQEDVHGFAILIKITGMLFTLAVLLYGLGASLYYVYFSIQRTLFEKNAELTIDEETLTITYKNEHLQQKQVTFVYSDIEEILQRAHRGTYGYYCVTLKTGESFIITAYMEGFVPIARKFDNEYPDKYFVKGGNILLPRKPGCFF